MCIRDRFFAFPLVLLAIAIVGVIGPGMGNQMFALAVVLVPYSTRVVRTATLSVKPFEFVEAARALGGSSGRLIGRHLLPNVLPPLLVYTSTLVGMMIVASAGLSFLGLGVQHEPRTWPPSPASSSSSPRWRSTSLETDCARPSTPARAGNPRVEPKGERHGR